MINKYAMMMAKMAYDMPKVSPVSPDKSDRIFEMINGNTDSVAKWFPPETYAKYRDFIKSASLIDDVKAGWNNMSAGEKMWYGLAGVGGGAGGYLLSKMLHRRRNTLRTLAYILGGGAAGLGGAYAYFNNSDAGKKTKEELKAMQESPETVVKREAVTAAKQEIAKAEAKSEDIKGNVKKVTPLIPLIAAGVGGYEGATSGKGALDISGRRGANEVATRIALENMSALNNAEVRQAKALDMLFGPGTPFHGKFYKNTLINQLLHPFYFHRTRVLRRLAQGTPVTAPDKATKMKLNMPAEMRDIGIDAGAHAAGYAIAGELLRRGVNAVTPSIAPSREAILAKYNLTPADIN